MSGADVSWCRYVVGPTCLRAEVSLKPDILEAYKLQIKSSDFYLHRRHKCAVLCNTSSVRYIIPCLNTMMHYTANKMISQTNFTRTLVHFQIWTYSTFYQPGAAILSIYTRRHVICLTEIDECLHVIGTHAYSEFPFPSFSNVNI